MSLDRGHREFLWTHANPARRSTLGRGRIRLMIKGNEDRLEALSSAELSQVGKLEIQKPQMKILDNFVSFASVPFVDAQAK